MMRITELFGDLPSPRDLDDEAKRREVQPNPKRIKQMINWLGRHIRKAHTEGWDSSEGTSGFRELRLKESHWAGKQALVNALTVGDWQSLRKGFDLRGYNLSLKHQGRGSDAYREIIIEVALRKP